jgi:hypothetical protein
MMKRTLVLAVLALGLLPPAAAAGPSVTVYSRDLGYVRETRTLTPGGRDTVRLADLPERLDFSSVRLVPAGGAVVTRLAYRWDLASGGAFLDNAVGRRVTVTSRGERVTEGTLVAGDGEWLVVRGDDGSVTTLARTAVEAVKLADLSSRFNSRPTLEAVLRGARGGSLSAELSYLTGGMSWSAEHALVRKGEREATWSADVTIANDTGRDYVDATLQLVAGEPNRTAAPMPRPNLMMMKSASAMAAPEQADFAEQGFSEYHLYSLGRPATLRGREQQSFSLIAPRAVKTVPRYVYRGGDPRGVVAGVEIVNDRAAGLGVPLPAGRVRFYETDAQGAAHFTGEATIKHTPEGEKLTLEMGAAFDLAAERRDLFNRRVSDREREYGVEIKLRNRKASDVTILVDESVGGDTQVTEKTHEFTRKDAGTIEFAVPVKAGAEVVLRYTAHVRY